MIKLPFTSPLKFLQIFRGHEFPEFFQFAVILRISRKLQQVPDHIECPSCIAYPINSDIRSRDGYPIDSGIRSCGRVPIISGDDQNPTRPEHRVLKFIAYPHSPIKYNALYTFRIFKKSIFQK